jgi:hypothetical protein
MTITKAGHHPPACILLLYLRAVHQPATCGHRAPARTSPRSLRACEPHLASSMGGTKRRRLPVAGGAGGEEKEKVSPVPASAPVPEPEPEMGSPLSRVLRDDALFNTLLDSIPDHLTLPAADEANAQAVASRYEKNRSGAAPQQSRKEQSIKNKRARYDPERVVATTLDKQQSAAAAAAAPAVSSSIAAVTTGAAKKAGKTARLEKSGVQQPEDADSVGSAALRARVQQRIEELRRNRQVKQGSHRDNRNKAKSASAAKGGKPKKPLVTKKEKKQPVVGSAKATESKAKSEDLPLVSSLNDAGANGIGDDISFGGLRVGNDGSSKAKVGKSGSKMGRLQSLLRAAENKAARLDELRKTREGRDQARDEGMSDAIKAAASLSKTTTISAGQARKAIKKREKAKAKSAQKWQERGEKVKESQGARQAKREQNLSQRQRRPGFEGKKEDFLNKPSGQSGKVDGSGGRRGGRPAADTAHKNK